MNITRNKINILTLASVGLLLMAAGLVSGDQIFAPECLWEKNIAEKTDPIEIANTHLGIPYRDDGALDGEGHFTTFADPDKFFETPGLNCSGLVVSACRFLLDKNWTLEQVTRDRQGNSGPGSALGKDWDFGWDLVMNLTEGRSRKVIMPDGRAYSVENFDGTTLVGFDLNDMQAWQRVMAQMKPGRAYLGSISKPTKKKGYKLLHYHVVLMLPDGKGGVWLYHATHRSNVHRMNLNSPQGMNRLMSQFRGDRDDSKKILVVEAVLPDLTAPVEAQAEPQTQPPTTSQRADQDSKPAADPSAASGPKPVAPESVSPKPESGGLASTGSRTPQSSPTAPSAGAQEGPNLALNHLSGKVFKAMPDLVTSIPRFADETKSGVRFWFCNRGNAPREVQILLQGPEGPVQYKGSIPPANGELTAVYPADFGKAAAALVREGKYLEEVRIDGAQWCANVFEVAKPREANPKILAVKVPSAVQSGQTFSVTVEAENKGAESDYGGITVSSPDPSGLKLVSAKPGRIYGPGSTVLSVTTDKIRTKVPMAERWIELWGENKRYDLTIQLQAGRPGTYPLYVRCALRGVNVKSSVIRMEPASSDAIDQQGFPVRTYNVTVR
ncbi:MAG: hypothetical protein HY913_01450 [Desulfomonile tiedjei]|nr:hypothetical protein [Desulfomonile tiedjei]